MLLGARMSMWGGKKPYEGPLWFIETGSTGTYRISTGVMAPHKTTYDIQFLPCEEYRRLMGHTPAYGVGYWGVSSNGKYEWNLSTVKNIPSGNRDTVVYKIYDDFKATLTVNGVDFGTLNGNSDLFKGRDNVLFAIQGWQGNFCHNTRLWGCRIEQGGKLVRDFVPWIQNGIVGLMDKVENKFYPNEGTGELTAGYYQLSNR